MADKNLMKDKLVIRTGEAEDVEAIAHFNILTARETENRELAVETAVSGVKAVFEDSSKGFYLVAEQEDEIVGQLMVTDEWSDWNNKYYFWIQSVYVRGDYRKRRVFSRLYRHLLDMARIRGDVISVRLYVEKDNRTAKRVYESLGMAQSIYRMYEISGFDNY